MGQTDTLYGELLTVLLCFGIFLLYHAWLFYPKKRTRIRKRGGQEVTTVDFHSVGQNARTIWLESIIYDPKEAILAVQTLRNNVMANTFLAGIITILANQTLMMTFDAASNAYLQDLQTSDPIFRKIGDVEQKETAINPRVGLLLSNGMALLSVLALVNSVRLSTHLAYIMRAFKFQDTYPQRYPISVKEQERIMWLMHMSQTLGMRLLYFYILLVMWLTGLTPLLISSVVVTFLVWLTDRHTVVLQPDKVRDSANGDSRKDVESYQKGAE